jgi:hypothetical protein
MDRITEAGGIPSNSLEPDILARLLDWLNAGMFAVLLIALPIDKLAQTTASQGLNLKRLN